MGAKEQTTSRRQKKVRRSNEAKEPATSPPKKKTECRVVSPRKKQEPKPNGELRGKKEEENSYTSGTGRLKRTPVSSRKRKISPCDEEENKPKSSKRTKFSETVEKLKDAKPSKLSRVAKGCTKESPTKIKHNNNSNNNNCKDIKGIKIDKNSKEPKVVLCNNVSISLEQSLVKEVSGKKELKSPKGIKPVRGIGRKDTKSIPVTRRTNSTIAAKNVKETKSPRRNSIKEKKDSKEIKNLKENKNSKENKEPNSSQDANDSDSRVIPQINGNVTSTTDAKSNQKAKPINARKTRLPKEPPRKKAKEVLENNSSDPKVDNEPKAISEDKVSLTIKEQESKNKVGTITKKNSESPKKGSKVSLEKKDEEKKVDNSPKTSAEVKATVATNKGHAGSCKASSPLKKGAKCDKVVRESKTKESLLNNGNGADMPKTKGKRVSQSPKAAENQDKEVKEAQKKEGGPVGKSAAEVEQPTDLVKVIESIKAGVMESIAKEEEEKKNEAKDSGQAKTGVQCGSCKRNFCNKQSLSRHMKKCPAIVSGNSEEAGSKKGTAESVQVKNTKDSKPAAVKLENKPCTSDQSESPSVENLGKVVELVRAAGTGAAASAVAAAAAAAAIPMPTPPTTPAPTLPDLKGTAEVVTDKETNKEKIEPGLNGSEDISAKSSLKHPPCLTDDKKNPPGLSDNKGSPLSLSEDKGNLPSLSEDKDNADISFSDDFPKELGVDCEGSNKNKIDNKEENKETMKAEQEKKNETVDVDAAAAAVVAALVAKIGTEIGLDSASIPKPHLCKQCDFQAVKHSLLARHVETHGIFMCLKCSFIGENKENCSVHMRESHKNKRSEKLCRQCRKYIDTDIISMEKHKKECSMRSLSCKECNKVFRYESSLKVHMATHFPDLPKRFHCPECEYQSNYKANLQKHMKSIHEFREKNVKCCVCEKKFFSEDSMKRHLKVHSDDRPYECDLCGKAFKSSPALKSHRDVHQPSRPFLCEVEGCSKDFRTARLLKNHREEYHQLSPKKYHCSKEGCNFSFFKRSHLRRHEITHTGKLSLIFSPPHLL